MTVVRAAYEVIGRGEPMLYFTGGPGENVALLRDDAERFGEPLRGAPDRRFTWPTPSAPRPRRGSAPGGVICAAALPPRRRGRAASGETLDLRPLLRQIVCPTPLLELPGRER
jgi:hypothetical protein